MPRKSVIIVRGQCGIDRAGSHEWLGTERRLEVTELKGGSATTLRPICTGCRTRAIGICRAVLYYEGRPVLPRFVRGKRRAGTVAPSIGYRCQGFAKARPSDGWRLRMVSAGRFTRNECI